MPRRLLSRLVLPLLALTPAAAGCGEEDPERSSGGAPAITNVLPYELGGADGSGADGEEERAERGGIAAGPDTREPGDRPYGDSATKPPR